MLNQSIAADLGAIRQHNDQVASLASTRELLARLAGTGPLADEQVWADYRSVETAAIAAPIVEALTARMCGVGRWQPLLRTGGPRARRCTWPTRMFDAFEHISGSHVRRDDLDIRLAAPTVARSCNGLVPVTTAGTPSLTYQRLTGAERGYFQGEGIAAASARLVSTQARIGITADYGGGPVASAHGMRFVVPVRSLYARPSSLYFGHGKRPRAARPG